MAIRDDLGNGVRIMDDGRVSTPESRAADTLNTQQAAERESDDIDALITEAVNASFDCGAWDDMDNPDGYAPLVEKARVARKKLRDAIDAAIQHAQQAVESAPERCPTCGVRRRPVAPDSPLAKAHREAVESERDKVLEEAAQIPRKYAFELVDGFYGKRWPDEATAILNASTNMGDRIRALKRQQPAQAEGNGKRTLEEIRASCRHAFEDDIDCGGHPYERCSLCGQAR